MSPSDPFKFNEGQIRSKSIGEDRELSVVLPRLVAPRYFHEYDHFNQSYYEITW